ncbi:MAG: glycine zipper domain-containing protein [Cyanobacteriota bacterium]
MEGQPKDGQPNGGQPNGSRPPQGGYEAFRERFEALIPTIQREWPQVARHTLEATRGSLDEVASVIASQTGRTVAVVQGQLLELLQVAEAQTQRLAHELEPLEGQLERLLDELDATLRPRIEKPVRERPLLALGIAAGVGLLTGLLLGSARRSA